MIHMHEGLFVSSGTCVAPHMSKGVRKHDIINPNCLSL